MSDPSPRPLLLRGKDRGVYAIRHLPTGTTYVGSSRNVPHRWDMHRCELQNGRHPSTPLQSAWDGSSPDAFAWELLERVAGDTAALRAAEQRWIKRYQHSGTSLYNLAPAERRETAVFFLRLEPTAARRLVELAAKLAISKTAVVHVALALLADRELPDPPQRIPKRPNIAR